MGPKALSSEILLDLHAETSFFKSHQTASIEFRTSRDAGRHEHNQNERRCLGFYTVWVYFQI